MTIESAASQPRIEFFNPGVLGIAAAEAAPPTRRRLAIAASDAPKGRILVVETQAVIALDVQRILRDAGYRVVGPATSSAEVAALLRRRPPECALIDLDSRPEDFATAARLLNEASVPIVVLGSGQGHGHHRTVAKPFTRPNLLAAIEEAISKDAEPVSGKPSSPPLP